MVSVKTANIEEITSLFKMYSSMLMHQSGGMVEAFAAVVYDIKCFISVLGYVDSLGAGFTDINLI